MDVLCATVPVAPLPVEADVATLAEAIPLAEAEVVVAALALGVEPCAAVAEAALVVEADVLPACALACDAAPALVAELRDAAADVPLETLALPADCEARKLAC